MTKLFDYARKRREKLTDFIVGLFIVSIDLKNNKCNLTIKCFRKLTNAAEISIVLRPGGSNKFSKRL